MVMPVAGLMLALCCVGVEDTKPTPLGSVNVTWGAKPAVPLVFASVVVTVKFAPMSASAGTVIVDDTVWAHAGVAESSR